MRFYFKNELLLVLALLAQGRRTTHIGDDVAANRKSDDQPGDCSNHESSHFTINYIKICINICQNQDQQDNFQRLIQKGTQTYHILKQNMLIIDYFIPKGQQQMQALQIDQSAVKPVSDEKAVKRHELIFFNHGITIVAGWFVILNSLDYFQSIYRKYDVYQFFLLAYLIGHVITIAAYRKITGKLSIQKAINIGLIVCTVAILLILVIALIFQHAPTFGFFLSVFLCMIVGISSNLVQLGYFGMLNFVSQKSIARFTVGTAFGGLVLTIIRMIITAISGTKPRLSQILIYYVIGCAFQIVDLFLNNIFCRSQYFLDKLAPFINRSHQTRKVLNTGQQNPSIPPQAQVSYFKQLIAVNKSIFPYPMIIFANFVITMMLFPDLTVKIKFDFSPVWSSLILLLLYTLGDMIGKYLVQIKNTFNKKSNLYLIIIRMVFFLLIPVLASGKVSDDPLVTNSFFPFLVLFLFGVSAGLVVSSSSILVSKKCQPSQKQLSGVLCGIAVQLGLITGTILAYPMQLIAPTQSL